MKGERRLLVGGHELEYAWFGKPAASDPVLVLLHDGLGSVSTWRDFPKRLADATGLAAFAYSRSGYGRSSKVELPRPVTFMHDEARLLPAVCAAAGIRRALLVGHSDGASIALLHASAPCRNELEVVALALIAPHVFVEDVTVSSIQELKRSSELGRVQPKLAAHHADPEHTFAGWSDIWLKTGFRSWNIESCLAGVQIPVLLAQGQDDEFGTQRQLDAIERGIPGSVERHVFPACGHSPQRDVPDEALEALVPFLTNQARPTS